jgi:hypothetical protein
LASPEAQIVRIPKKNTLKSLELHLNNLIQVKQVNKQTIAVATAVAGTKSPLLQAIHLVSRKSFLINQIQKVAIP